MDDDSGDDGNGDVTTIKMAFARSPTRDQENAGMPPLGTIECLSGSAALSRLTLRTEQGNRTQNGLGRTRETGEKR